MKILITGFQPFGGATINPAYEAIKLLPDTIEGAEIIKLEVPVVFEEDAKVLEEAMIKHRPNVTICVGQAGGRSSICVEKVAINLMEARIPDNAGKQPFDQPVCTDGENAYFTNLPVKAMVKNIQEKGIPAKISYTAGTYVCNDIMYRLLYLIEKKYPKMKGGFIHVPYLSEQVVTLPDLTPSMSTKTITDALYYAIESIVSDKAFVASAMGETE